MSRRASTITSAAPASAVHARFNPAKKTGEDHHKHDTNQREQTAVELRNNVRVTVDYDTAQDASKTKTDDRKVDR